MNIPYAVVSHRTVAERVRTGGNVDKVVKRRIIMASSLLIIANFFYAWGFNNVYTSERYLLY
jgi:hypothetical protein